MKDYNSVIDDAIEARRQKGEAERLNKEMMWGGSEQGWLALYAAPATKGATGKDAVAAICQAAGITLQKRHSWGFGINDHAVAVKFAVLGMGDSYVFENIRHDSDIVFCLGVSPNGGKHAWVLTEEYFGYLKVQHKGKTSDKGDMWVHICPAEVPEWLCHQSGKVADAVQMLKDITRR